MLQAKLLRSRSSSVSRFGFFFFLGFLCFLCFFGFLSRLFLFFFHFASSRSGRSSRCSRLSSENNASERNSNESSNDGGKNLFHDKPPKDELCTTFSSIRAREEKKGENLKKRPLYLIRRTSALSIQPQIGQQIPQMRYLLPMLPLVKKGKIY